MRQILIILSFALLSGCSILPQKIKFPEPDKKLMMPAPQLLTLKNETVIPDDKPSGVQLSEATKTITENYKIYNIIAERLHSLQEWIIEQKKIYNK